MILESGTGNGYAAGIASDNHILTAGRQVDLDQLSALRGQGFNLNTGVINLTSANESGLLYAKSDGASIGGVGLRMICPLAVFMVTPGSGSLSEYWRFKCYRNPTTGTLISGGSDLAGVNRDCSNSREWDHTTKKGAEGSTITNGDVVVDTIIPAASSGRFVVAAAVSLDQGSSVAWSIEPPTGNTSCNVMIATPFFMVNNEDF